MHTILKMPKFCFVGIFIYFLTAGRLYLQEDSLQLLHKLREWDDYLSACYSVCVISILYWKRNIISLGLWLFSVDFFCWLFLLTFQSWPCPDGIEEGGKVFWFFLKCVYMPSVCGRYLMLEKYLAASVWRKSLYENNFYNS